MYKWYSKCKSISGVTEIINKLSNNLYISIYLAYKLTVLVNNYFKKLPDIASIDTITISNTSATKLITKRVKHIMLNTLRWKACDLAASISCLFSASSPRIANTNAGIPNTGQQI